NCRAKLARSLPRAWTPSGQRLEQALHEPPAGRERGDEPVFVERMRSLAVDAEAVEARHAERRREVAVTAAAGHGRIGEFEANIGGKMLRMGEQPADLVGL